MEVLHDHKLLNPWLIPPFQEDRFSRNRHSIFISSGVASLDRKNVSALT